jgi:5-hydroxyisourate hydrolase
MGRLTTHVLDTARGKPAAGMIVELWSIDDGGARTRVKTVITNRDGRIDTPLLEGHELEAGVYELVFLVGDYFDGIENVAPAPRFLDRVPIRFGIADADAHYHVPLLTSRWAYSTYRGS